MDVIKDILSVLNEKLDKENTSILIGDKQISFDAAKIKPLQQHETDVFVGFVDGGNAEILKGANFSVQFIRVFGSLYHGLKKLHTFKQEFFVLIHTVVQGTDIFYDIVAFDTADKFFRVHARDPDLTSRNTTLTASSVGNIVRKVAELRLARLIVEKMASGIMVLDGDLDVKNEHEKHDLEALENGCTQKQIHLVGLSKTTQLLTNSGDSAVAALATLGKGSWYYASGDRVSFAKLHQRSNYVFRLDVKGKIGEVAGILARYAKDPVFLGYPYGLVEADRFARVSNEEKEYLKTLFLAQSGDLSRYLHAQDAHSVLDSVG